MCNIVAMRTSVAESRLPQATYTGVLTIDGIDTPNSGGGGGRGVISTYIRSCIRAANTWRHRDPAGILFLFNSHKFHTQSCSKILVCRPGSRLQRHPTTIRVAFVAAVRT